MKRQPKVVRSSISGARGFRLKATLVAAEEQAKMDAAGRLFDFGTSIGVAIGGSGDAASGQISLWCERSGGQTTDDDRKRVLAYLLTQADVTEVELGPLSPSPYVATSAPPIDPSAVEDVPAPAE